MRNSLIKLFSLIAIACSVTSAQVSKVRPAGSQSAENEIKKLELQRFNAYLKLDATALERIMADNYTSVYADGQVVTRAEELAGIHSAGATTLSSLNASIDQLSVKQFGLSAVLTGRLRVKGTINWFEKTINIDAAFRYTAIYVKRLGRWRVVASQFTKIDQGVDSDSLDALTSESEND